MKPRVMCELICATEIVASIVRDNLVSDLSGKDILRSDFDVSSDDLIQGVCVGDVQFRVEADATAWQEQVAARWAGSLVILAGSRVHQHRCPHPDGEESYHCSEDVRAAYAESVKA